VALIRAVGQVSGPSDSPIASRSLGAGSMMKAIIMELNQLPGRSGDLLGVTLADRLDNSGSMTLQR
jgi:hypothetical protein